MSLALYDTIGHGYAKARRADARVAAAIHAALGDARSVVNVGAGTGSYKPRDRLVVAIEPSMVMIRQRPSRRHVARAVAERLPLADGSFDAAMATSTVHHWTDRVRGLREMRRVSAQRVVVFTYVRDAGEHFWLDDDHFPDEAREAMKSFPTEEELEAGLGPIEMRPMPVPHDCEDGGCGAYWRTPQAYLEESVWRSISTFARLPAARRSAALHRLAEDLASGAWHEKHGDLLARNELDLGVPTHRHAITGLQEPCTQR